jgi:hypothetical protein
VTAKIGLGTDRPAPLDRRKPLPVECPHRIVGIEEAQKPACQLSRRRVRGQPEIDMYPLGRPVEQPGIGQQFQMPRHARLALPENFHHVADSELALGQKRDQPKPRRLRERPERLEEMVRSHVDIHT